MCFDNYLWIIPLWVEIIDILLHWWTIKNLRNNGGMLGHIDTVELSEGRMLIDLDTRKPLTFTRKISQDGKEISIQIHYDKFFKHCTTCRMLTHEQDYCPMKATAVKGQGERPGVYERVQLPDNQTSRSLCCEIRNHIIDIMAIHVTIMIAMDVLIMRRVVAKAIHLCRNKGTMVVLWRTLSLVIIVRMLIWGYPEKTRW